MTLVCQGTSCENSLGDVLCDTFNLIIYAMTLLVMGYFYITGETKSVVLIVCFYLLILVGVLVGINRFIKWRKRVEAMRLGISRLLGEGGAPTPSTSGMMELRSMKFRKTLHHMDNPNEEYTCAICLDRIMPSENVNLLSCSHCFHRECIKAWIVLQPTCPTCRSPH
jgi:hypothetical protein